MFFFNISSSIIILYVIIVSIIKFLPVLGINPKNKIKPIIAHEGVQVTIKSMIKIFGLALVFRIMLYLISLVSAIFILKPSEISLEFFLNAWEKWDAPRYVSIVEHGYGATIFGEPEPYNIVFFPLYPWVVRLFTLIIPNTQLACIIVSMLFYSLAMPFMYALIASEYGKKIAKLSLIFVSISPFSFFLGAMMTESTLLFTTILTWYLIKKRKWLPAAISGAFCSMSRIVGILIVIPYIMELIEYNAESFKNKKYKEWFFNCIKQGFWIFIIPLGLIIYLILNYYYTGNCFKFLEYQYTFWHHSFCYFGQGIQNICKLAFSNSRSLIEIISLFLPQALSYIFSIILLLTCCKRHRSVYTFYYLTYFIITTSNVWIISGARYTIVVLPLYIMLSERLKNHDLITLSLIVTSVLLYGIYSTMYLGGFPIM